MMLGFSSSDSSGASAGIGRILAVAGWLALLPADAPPLKGASTGAALLRAVQAVPPAPRSGQPVQIVAEVAASITNLVLQYQWVDPGTYIERKDPAFQIRWLNLAMQPANRAAEAARFTIELPATWQVNRRLVRYRFAARDNTGRPITLPAAEDPVPNFAYFVYDGVPAWTGAVQPRSGDARLGVPVTYDPAAMRRVQSYFLIGRGQSITNVTWNEPTGGKEYKYTATLVADGRVYDHVRIRARGGVWRFAMGKNMWKYDLPKTDRLQASDDYGAAYPVAWSKVNLRACIQQADYGYRGEQGLFESVGFRLFRLAGVPAPFTHWIQLRIVTAAEETPADQYGGDYWGLYLAIEDVDGRFLRAHDLPDGNLYKMDGGFGALSHHGTGAVTNSSDLGELVRAYRGARQSAAWWQSHVDLPEYYSYRSICECIHHYDIGDGKNYDYYFNPKTRRWEVIPWDIDLTWADTMYGSGDEPFYRPVLSQPGLRLQFQNRLREIRDLLFNADEAGRLIDECAAVVADPAGGPSPVDADRAKWDFHPVMAMGGKAGQGRFYQIAPTRDFRGMVQLMKDYVRTRSAWLDAYRLADPALPGTPTLTYTGPANFPTGQLTFRASAYHGAQPFAALQFRIAEVSPAPTVKGRPTAPGKYEITPLWQTGEVTAPPDQLPVPPNTVLAGHHYRARVRVKDTTGRWSHWSAPVEFTASP